MTPNSLHVVIISAVYPPEPVVSARMAWDLAHYLADRGNKVTVVCPQPTRPVNADYGPFTKPGALLLTREDGVEVVRLPSYAAPQSNLIARMRESYSFGREVCRYLSGRKQQPDVIYVNAWPLLAQATIARYVERSSIPMVLQIMDVYPESLLNKIPGIPGRIVAFPLIKLDQWIARQATAIVTISENMRQTYTAGRGIPAANVKTINLWQDESLFASLPDRNNAFACYNVPHNLFTFLFLGNIGPVAGVKFLIRAFHRAALPSAQLVIAGDGAARSACQGLVRSMGVSNVRFISDPDVTHVPLLQSMADVCLLPVKRGAAMSSIPSKLPAYLFSAKPVLATVDVGSDTACAIRQADCGWVGEPDDQEWLAEKMREVASLPQEELLELGQNGREFGLEYFSRAKGVVRLSEIVLSATSAFTRDSTG